MKKTGTLVKSFLPSLLIAAFGLVIIALGLAPRFSAGAAEMIDFPQMYLGVAIAVLIAFAFGAIRYSLPVGCTLGLMMLNDLLVTLAVTALCSFLLPQTAVMPVLLLFVPVFTLAGSLTVIRAARDLRAAGSTRDLSDEEAAQKATASTRALRVGGALLALVFIAAGAVGGLKLASTLLPLVIGLAVSLVSSCLLTGKVWRLTGSRAAVKGGR